MPEAKLFKTFAVNSILFSEHKGPLIGPLFRLTLYPIFVGGKMSMFSVNINSFMGYLGNLLYDSCINKIVYTDFLCIQYLQHLFCIFYFVYLWVEDFPEFIQFFHLIKIAVVGLPWFVELCSPSIKNHYWCSLFITSRTL